MTAINEMRNSKNLHPSDLQDLECPRCGSPDLTHAVARPEKWGPSADLKHPGRLSYEIGKGWMYHARHWPWIQQAMKDGSEDVSEMNRVRAYIWCHGRDCDFRYRHPALHGLRRFESWGETGAKRRKLFHIRFRNEPFASRTLFGCDPDPGPAGAGMRKGDTTQWLPCPRCGKNRLATHLWRVAPAHAKKRRDHRQEAPWELAQLLLDLPAEQYRSWQAGRSGDHSFRIGDLDPQSIVMKVLDLDESRAELRCTECARMAWLPHCRENASLREFRDHLITFCRKRGASLAMLRANPRKRYAKQYLHKIDHSSRMAIQDI